MSKSMALMCIFPVALSLSMIKTLNRLSIASMIANILQVFGLFSVMSYLLVGISFDSLAERDYFKPIDETVIAVGSTMFAFEAITIIMPLYSRMSNSNQMLFAQMNSHKRLHKHFDTLP